MRTLQEKYIGVTEDRFSKAQFKRDAIMECSHLVSHFNSFDDVVTILINRGVISEVKQENKYAETDAKPEDHIAPDILDTAIKFECDEKHGTLDVSEEEFEKCKVAAIKNLEKDVNYYVKKSAGIKDEKEPSDQMEKVTLKEAIQNIENDERTVERIKGLLTNFIEDNEEDTERIGFADFVIGQLEAGKDIEDYKQVMNLDDIETEYDNYLTTDLEDTSDLEEGKAEQLAKLKQHRAQIMRDMEQEAEMEGGPIADKYGAMLDKIDRAIAQLTGKKEKEYKLMEEDEVDEWGQGSGIYYKGEKKEDDEDVDEVQVQVNIPGQDPRNAEDGKEYSEEEADEFIEKAKKHGATPMNTTFKKVNEDYEPRTKEDLVFQYLRDAWQFGATKGKDVNPDEELSTMADSLLANLPDYDSHEPSEDPDVEDLYQHDQEKLDQLKRDQLRESFRTLIKKVIEG